MHASGGGDGRGRREARHAITARLLPPLTYAHTHTWNRAGGGEGLAGQTREEITRRDGERRTGGWANPRSRTLFIPAASTKARQCRIASSGVNTSSSPPWPSPRSRSAKRSKQQTTERARTAASTSVLTREKKDFTFFWFLQAITHRCVKQNKKNKTERTILLAKKAKVRRITLGVIIIRFVPFTPF